MGVSCNNRETKDYVFLYQLLRKRIRRRHKYLSIHTWEVSDCTWMRQAPQKQDPNGRYRNNRPRIETQRGTCLPAKSKEHAGELQSRCSFLEEDRHQRVNVTKEVEDNTAIRHTRVIRHTCSWTEITREEPKENVKTIG